MEVKQLKEKIKIAHESVENELEPYKMEAFKIILEKLLHDITNSKQVDSNQITDIQTIEQNTDSTQSLFKLATKCDLEIQELTNVLELENNEIILLKKMNQDTDAKNQVVASQIILTARMKGLNEEWTKTSVLLEIGLKNRLGFETNLSRNLTQSKIFRTKGQGRATEYSLTTDGWQEGLKIITTLARGDQNNASF